MMKNQSLTDDNQSPKVLLQYFTLIHYRQSVFEEVAADPRIDFTICCGRKSPYQKMTNFEPQPPLKVHWVRNLVVNITQKHFLIWQWGACWNLIRNRPDVLILLGLDPHNLSSAAQFFLAKLLRIKVCWWSHATLNRQGPVGRLARLFFYRNADGILAYDENGRQRMEDAGIKPEMTQTIWNCLNNADYSLCDPSQKTERTRDEIRLLYIGRIYRDKKMHLLIEAVKVLTERGVNVKVDIVGEGPELENTQQLTKKMKLDSIIQFHGPKFTNELKPYLEAADLGVVPSWAGLSAIQYMAAGIPVITEENREFNHPPEVSAIVENQTGAFFKFEDATSLADTIERLSPEIERISKACLALVNERFTPKAVANSIIEGVLKVWNG